MEIKDEIKIYVIYLGIGNTDDEDINTYVKMASEKIIPTNIKGEVIIIPTRTTDTRIECINPKYITDDKLIKEHENLMKQLNNNLEELKEVKTLKK